MSSLFGKLRDTETYNNQLADELSNLKSQLQDQEAEKSRLSELENHLVSLKAELGGKDAAVAQVQNDLDCKKEECELLRRQLEEKVSEHDNLEDRVDKLSRDLELKENELRQLQIDLQTRQKLDEVGDSKAQELQDLLITQSHEIEELKRRLTEHTEEMSSVEARIITLEEELEEERKSSQRRLDEESSRLMQKSSFEISQVQAQLFEKGTECEKLQTERNEEAKVREDMKRELVQLREKISILHTELDVERERANNAEKNAKVLQQKLKEEQLERETLLKEREAMEGSELNSLKSQLESMKSQYEFLSNDNDNYQSLMTTLTANNSAMKREIEELRFKLKRSGGGGDSREDTSHDSEKAMAELTKRMEEAEREKEELNEEFEEVREELVTLRREKTSLAQQAGDLSNTVQQLKEKMADLEYQLNESTAAKITSEASELPIKVERSTPLGAGPGESSPKHQMKFDEELRSELSASQAENRQLQAELDRLSWRLGELEGLEQEIDELRSTSASSNMEKKILVHDLDEVRAELSALQTDKHLLMKEVRDQSGLCLF